jgi:hypothetical protein
VTFQEDEFSCGQPALLYKANVKAEQGNDYTPELTYMSLWDNGENTLAPVDSTITTAQNVFDTITVSIVKPKPRLFKKRVLLSLHEPFAEDALIALGKITFANAGTQK